MGARQDPSAKRGGLRQLCTFREDDEGMSRFFHAVAPQSARCCELAEPMTGAQAVCWRIGGLLDGGRFLAWVS